MSLEVYSMVQSEFWYREPFRCDTRVCQTERRTNKHSRNIYCA